MPFIKKKCLELHFDFAQRFKVLNCNLKKEEMIRSFLKHDGYDLAEQSNDYRKEKTRI